ncbi:MAG: pilus assembly FimT family protein [Terriglobales bacterium]
MSTVTQLRHPGPGPHRAAGFSFTELLIAMTVLVVMLALAVVGYQHMWPGVEANAALDGLEAQLRLARQDALTQRRTFEVSFVAPNQMTISRVELSGTLTTEPGYTLPNTSTFQVFAGLPDTPDAFGDASAIDFTDVNGGAGGDTLLFLANGSVTDLAGNDVNGTVFLGLTGNSQTARAVTLYGITGILHGYSYDSATGTFQ